MPEYFEARERALLGARYEELYRPLTEAAARGVTVNGLRCTPGGFAAGAGIALQPSPFWHRHRHRISPERCCMSTAVCS